MGNMLPKPVDMGVVDLAFMVYRGKEVIFPGTGYIAYVVEVEQEELITPRGAKVNSRQTGTLLYIYNMSPNDITNLKEAK